MDGLTISAAGAGLGRFPSSSAPRPAAPAALALAVESDAFLAVQGPEEAFFAQAGLFRVDASGRLLSAGGLPLLPPVAVPAEAESLFISADGRILVLLAGGAVIREIGRLDAVRFDRPEGLQARGGGLFSATSASGPPRSGATASYFSGVIEGLDLPLSFAPAKPEAEGGEATEDRRDSAGNAFDLLG